jgi:hypothetical protein
MAAASYVQQKEREEGCVGTADAISRLNEGVVRSGMGLFLIVGH